MTFSERASTVNEAVLDTLGDEATYTDASSGEQHTIRVIYSAPYTEQSGGYGAVSTQDPRIETSEAELDAAGITPDRDDEVHVDGKTYAVVTPEERDDGWVTIHLEAIS